MTFLPLKEGVRRAQGHSGEALTRTGKGNHSAAPGTATTHHDHSPSRADSRGLSVDRRQHCKFASADVMLRFSYLHARYEVACTGLEAVAFAVHARVFHHVTRNLNGRIGWQHGQTRIGLRGFRQDMSLCMEMGGVRSEAFVANQRELSP